MISQRAAEKPPSGGIICLSIVKMQPAFLKSDGLILEDIDIDERIILKRTIWKYGRKSSASV
jgi:hypothetical protein